MCHQALSIRVFFLEGIYFCLCAGETRFLFYLYLWIKNQDGHQSCGRWDNFAAASTGTSLFFAAVRPGWPRTCYLWGIWRRHLRVWAPGGCRTAEGGPAGKDCTNKQNRRTRGLCGERLQCVWPQGWRSNRRSKALCVWECVCSARW